MNAKIVLVILALTLLSGCSNQQVKELLMSRQQLADMQEKAAVLKQQQQSAREEQAFRAKDPVAYDACKASFDGWGDWNKETKDKCIGVYNTSLADVKSKSPEYRRVWTHLHPGVDDSLGNEYVRNENETRLSYGRAVQQTMDAYAECAPYSGQALQYCMIQHQKR